MVPVHSSVLTDEAAREWNVCVSGVPHAAVRRQVHDAPDTTTRGTHQRAILKDVSWKEQVVGWDVYRSKE